MRYLRMLTNAVAAAALMAIYLSVLVLQLNPQLRLFSRTSLEWVGTLLAFYGPNVTVGVYLVIVARDLVATTPLRPAWLSVRLLGWLAAVEAASVAVLTWINLRAFGAVMSDAGFRRMEIGAWVTSAAAAVLLAVALLRYSFGRRGSRPAGAMLVAAVSLSVVVPLWARGAGEAPPAAERRRASPVVAPVQAGPAVAVIQAAPRVRVLALDGASLGFIRQRVAAGQLPNFGRLLDRGATLDLATMRPTQDAPVWAAAATGKSAQKNGVRSSRIYRVRAGDPEAVDILPNDCFAYALVEQGFAFASDRLASALRARPIWDILADYGLTPGVAGWPLTYPAHLTRGFLLSERFKKVESSPLRVLSGAGDPTTAMDVGRDTFNAWQARPWQDALAGSLSRDPQPVGIDQARWDHAYSESAAELALEFAPRLLAVRYEGLATLGHVYLRDAVPEAFGDPRRPGLQRPILDRYYAYIDDEVGAAVRGLEPGDLLLVVSGFGMEPVTLPRRLLARVLGNLDISGTHEAAPAGFLMAYGSNVASGGFPPGAVVDLAPTILYYLGVPVGRDMDGIARRDLFVAGYAQEHLVKYVASHEH